MYKIPATPLFLGKNMIFMPECHSTNDLALQLCQQSGTPEGTMVVTANQTSGRGQRGNTWEAEPGRNLTFSLILKPRSISVQEQFFLSMCVSLGLYDYLTEKLTKKVQIKWPNDMLIEGKKIAGILIENQITGSLISNAIVGIGLNVNQTSFSHNTATSLCLEDHHEHDLSEVLNELMSALEKRYLQLRERKVEQLRNDYLNYLYRRNERCTYQAHGEHFKGEITGLDAIGRLRILVGNEERIFDIKEITYC